MKKFTVITALLSASLLSVWMIFQAFAASPVKNDHTPIKVHDAYGELLQVVQSGNKADVPVTGAEVRKVAPVFDATGAVVSDPTGLLWSERHAANVNIAPVFDVTGAVISDPSGTLLGEIDSADRKIAPVFDATGAVVSDPTGTLLNANPR